MEVHGEGGDENDVGAVGDAVEGLSGLTAVVVAVAAACSAVLAAIFSSIVGGCVCGMEPGGKRRKKLSKGFGRVFASCSYCRMEAISSSIKHPRE